MNWARRLAALPDGSMLRRGGLRLPLLQPAAASCAAVRVAQALGAVEHRTMRIDLGGIGGSALTDPSIAVPESPQIGIPVTYVPARNTLALALG